MSRISQIIDIDVDVDNLTLPLNSDVDTTITRLARFTGVSSISSPTLGNLVSSKVRVEIDDLFSPPPDPGQNTYLFAQSGTVVNTREFDLFRQSDFTLNSNAGGGGNIVLTTQFASIFGSTTLDGDLVYEYDFTNGDYQVIYNGRVVISDNISPLSNRVDGELFRLGARNGGENVVEGTLMGNTRVYIDDVLVRDYSMPGFGTKAPEAIGSNDGTVIDFTAGDQIWATKFENT